MNALTQALQAVWEEEGRPSTRVLAHRTEGRLTHTTVSNVLYGRSIPRWSSVALVAHALGVDPHQFYDLWREEYDAHEARRHARSGRIRAANLKEGLVIRPGDTLVVTMPEPSNEEDGGRWVEQVHEDLKFLFPGVEVRLLVGMGVAVIRREEAAA